MNNYTKEDIIRLVEEEDVEFIRLQFTDLFGNLKNIAVTASQLDRVLNNKCMFDGSAIDGFARIEESDMYLYPDLSTLEIFPWRPQQGKVARMICDVYRPNGQPFEGDPRYVLKRAVQQAEDMGYTFEVGPECEFFLFNTDENTMPTTNTHEQAGYFDIGPLDFGENARRDIVMNLEDMGFVIEASHHEMAPAQHEIDFKYDEALHTADNIMTFKMAVRTIAKRHGLFASFMPKPKYGINGSGMHINMSLQKDGKNIFQDASDPNGLSKEAYYFIGGIMKHIKGMAAITNPLVNSYKRLVPGFEAPVYIAWSTTNRSPDPDSGYRGRRGYPYRATQSRFRSKPLSDAGSLLKRRLTGHSGEDPAPREHQCEHFCTDRQRAERAEHRPAAGHFAGGSGRTGEGYLYPGCLRRSYCREIHRCQAQGMA